MNPRAFRLIRRAVFGSLALIASVGFAAFAGVLLFVQPAGAGKHIFRDVLVDCFAVAALFMLLAAVQSFSGGSQWVMALMDRTGPKASLVILAFAIGICVFATMIMAFG